MKFIVVEWLDAKSEYGWGASDKPQLAKVVSVGILMPSSDDEVLRIAQSLADDGDYADTLAIPRSCVVETTEMEQFDGEILVDGGIAVEDKTGDPQ